MKIVIFILNIPWTIIGLLIALFSLPINLHISEKSLVVKVKRIWLGEPFYCKRRKGLTLGNIILQSSISESNTMNHELIHRKQFQRYPLIFPVLYLFEHLLKGHSNNKYEKEANGA